MYQSDEWSKPAGSLSSISKSVGYEVDRKPLLLTSMDEPFNPNPK
jgi:hypothetical protein